MLTKIEALNYRCLRDIEQTLGPFHVLVGPNASGKSTFLDVIRFMSDVVREGPMAAVAKRASDYRDLFWRRTGSRFELAVEAKIPERLLALLGKTPSRFCRYELVIGTRDEPEEIAILDETLFLLQSTTKHSIQRAFSLSRHSPRKSLLYSGARRSGFKAIRKTQGGNVFFRSESRNGSHLFKLGPQKSALANLPEDEEKFPVSTWFKKALQEGVQVLTLNSNTMRWPCPPGTPRQFNTDGSNLPLVIEDLKTKSSTRFDEWIGHIQTALPEIEDIRVVEREEDRHKYIVIRQSNNLEIPSWLTSDGTLRLLALTLLAYLPDIRGIYLIEEPENGIHPKAIQTVYQSLSSVYDGQVLIATHSPILLSITEPEFLLCFAKTDEGYVDVVSGKEHPNLKTWRKEVSLGDLFASGILG